MSQIILGIDCCTRWTNLGLAVDGVILSEMNLNIGRQQASKLPELVEHMLTMQNIVLEDISAVALTVGPGYFTGVRVGIAYGCALAKGLEIPVIPLSTLEVMAYSASKFGITAVPLVWAGRGGVYAAAYCGEGDGLQKELIHPSFFEIDDIRGEISRLYNEQDNNVCCLCDDVKRIAELFSETPGYPLVHCIVSGGILAYLGTQYKAREVSPEQVRPLYLRDPDFGTFQKNIKNK